MRRGKVNEMDFEEIRKFAENIDRSDAFYMIGYLKGYHGIEANGIDKQKVKEVIDKIKLPFLPPIHEDYHMTNIHNRVLWKLEKELGLEK